ncbi:MAG: PQQ-binding-like beta-propeller repeat protein [Candidatus Sumerlaeaceae bacterium]
MDLDEMVFVGFGKHVVALDRATGTMLWKWQAPKGKAYPALLLDGDRLFVSLLGYTFCLDPYTGRVMWENYLPGLGMGVACIATVRANTQVQSAAHAAEAAEAAQRAQR